MKLCEVYSAYIEWEPKSELFITIVDGNRPKSGIMPACQIVEKYSQCEVMSF